MPEAKEWDVYHIKKSGINNQQNDCGCSKWGTSVFWLEVDWCVRKEKEMINMPLLLWEWFWSCSSVLFLFLFSSGNCHPGTFPHKHRGYKVTYLSFCPWDENRRSHFQFYVLKVPLSQNVLHRLTVYIWNPNLMTVIKMLHQKMFMIKIILHLQQFSTPSDKVSPLMFKERNYSQCMQRDPTAQAIEYWREGSLCLLTWLTKAMKYQTMPLPLQWQTVLHIVKGGGGGLHTHTLTAAFSADKACQPS